MRRQITLSVATTLVVLLGACSASAPLAPVGLNKQPANNPDTIAELKNAPSLGVVSPPAETPGDQESAVSATIPLAKTATYLPDITVSDFEAPGGLSSLSPDLQSQVLLSAEHASLIVVRARTDFNTSTPRAKAAAIHRGADAKLYLIGRGIPAAKIRLFYRSAGGFIDNNATSNGRAKNRRVEIQFL